MREPERPFKVHMADEPTSATLFLVVGSTADHSCGVWDYTRRLQQELVDSGVTVELVHAPSGSWHLARLASLIGRLRSSSSPIVHLQYPSVGFGYSLVPQILLFAATALGIKTVATLHEFSLAKLPRKLADAPLMAADRLIFVAEAERERFFKWFPWRRNRSAVIPTGSNIPHIVAQGERSARVTYFGLLQPGKHLEQFIDLASRAQGKGLPLAFEVIGRPDERYKAYAEDLMRRAAYQGIRWFSDLDAEGVAERLATTMFAYLPFPDGASERRGSLLATLGNGVTTLTTVGDDTPEDLARVVRPAATPEAAVTALKELMRDPAERKRLSNAGRQYARARSWKTIVQRHLSLYRDLL